MNDRGVSELLGYAIIAGMVATAVICVTSGAGGMIVSSVERIAYNEATSSIESLADVAGETARANNTWDRAYELQAPAGYDLLVVDLHDDVSRLDVKLGDQEAPAIRMGSIRLQSPFRSISFEGGAAFGNDSGMVNVLRRPSVFIASHDGRKELYVYLVCIEAETGGTPAGGHTVMYARTTSQRSESISVPVPSEAVISITSRDPGGWLKALESRGFAVTCDGSTVTAIAGGVSGVHVTRVTLRVRLEGR